MHVFLFGRIIIFFIFVVDYWVWKCSVYYIRFLRWLFPQKSILVWKITLASVEITKLWNVLNDIFQVMGKKKNDGIFYLNSKKYLCDKSSVSKKWWLHKAIYDLMKCTFTSCVLNISYNTEVFWQHLNNILNQNKLGKKV